MNRKKKLRIAQISLLVLGSLILIFTYSERTVSKKEKIIPEITQEKIKEQLSKEKTSGDIFYNIE